MQQVQVKRSIPENFKEQLYISDHLMISDSISTGKGIRIYVENVLLPLGASAEKIKTNI